MLESELVNMETEIRNCPICNTEVDVGDSWEWGIGDCPNCGNGYFWDEMPVYEGEAMVDHYPCLLWDKYIKEPS